MNQAQVEIAGVSTAGGVLIGALTGGAKGALIGAAGGFLVGVGMAAGGLYLLAMALTPLRNSIANTLSPSTAPKVVVR